MSDSQESQCYFVQLQIDSYLDDELGAPQREAFTAHVQGCAACRAELLYARTIQDGLMDLPLRDCPDSALEPVYRLTQAPETRPERRAEPGTGLLAWLAGAPRGLRYAFPALLLLLVSAALWTTLSGDPEPPAVAQQPVADYSPEEVMTALRELNLAIDYLNEVSERTEVMIGERFLIRPLRETLDASFEQVMDLGDSDASGPI